MRLKVGLHGVRERGTIMSQLEEILYKRLERIREELDSYIAERTEKYLRAVPQISKSVAHQSVTKMADTADDYRFAPMKTRTEAPPQEISIPQFLCASIPKRDLDMVLEKKAETFSTMLLRLIDEKGLKDSEVYKKANIDRRLFSKIRGDEEYVPSKKTAISFCLALQLEMDEAKKLLKTAGYALSEASRFDLIIMYLIENNEYNIHFANIVLNDYGVGSLSK